MPTVGLSTSSPLKHQKKPLPAMPVEAIIPLMGFSGNYPQASFIALPVTTYQKIAIL
jgi:hypothetical protein